ncbi:MAG: tetratricopeptide repeat protein [Alphaproteobacteria bacterium]|nr:MAG: tetratricopeptide repeat protein [Alphaproteobacteria bacterium]
MFPMKIFYLIFLFTIIAFFTSCGNNLKQNTTEMKFEESSNFGRFLSTKYSLKLGDNDIASKIISSSKNLQSDLILAELNFNSYLIKGDFDKAKEFKLIAPSGLNNSPMYDLPDFIINLKNEKLINTKNLNFMKNRLPGFNIIFENINYMKLVKTNNFDNVTINKNKTNIFKLLIFEDTRIENQVYLNMPKTDLSIIENILFLEYLKRNNLKKFNEEINNFSLRFNYDIKTLKLYFENQKNGNNKPNHKFIFANLFSYLSFILTSKKNIPNSYLKILNEISHYLEPTLGNSNYFLAEIYSNEKNFKIALNKLNRIQQNSLMFLYSRIKKYKILKIIDKNKSNLLLKSLEKEYPENNQVLSLIANNYRDQNKCDKAIKIYNKLIVQSEKNYNYNYLKAICLDKLNKWEDSKKILIELISKNPNDAYALNYLSYSMAIRDEDLIKAKKLITKALEIEKNNGFFLDTLGWIQFKLNDIDKAVRSLQLAIELEPNNSEILDHLGDIYFNIGRKKEAIYEWKRALIGNPDYKLKKDIKSKLDKYAQ